MATKHTRSTRGLTGILAGTITSVVVAVAVVTMGPGAGQGASAAGTPSVESLPTIEATVDQPPSPQEPHHRDGSVSSEEVEPPVEPLPPADGPAPVTTPLDERPVVVLYGDSLSWESHEHFVAAFTSLPHVQVVTRTFGGTAICDFFDAMGNDAAELAPGAVVVQFSGNALTPCMQDGSGQPLVDEAYLQRYRADAEAAIEIFESVGTHVYLAGAPIPRLDGQSSDFRGGVLNQMYAEVASAHPGAATYVDAGAAVLEAGRWVEVLPCLPDEPCDGVDDSGRAVNVVRAPDGNHFCPTGDDAQAGVTSTCRVWSSGAYRFARAMASAVTAALGV
jgi:hypothetical protein